MSKASKKVRFPPSRILVPIDGSENATRALTVGIELSKAFAAEVVVLNVIPAPNVLVEARVGVGLPPDGLSEYYQRQENDSNRFIEEAMKVVNASGVLDAKSEVVRAEKSFAEEIIEKAASQKIDLIVIGTRGIGGFKKLLQGSVSSEVVALASCNTVVVR